MDMPFLGAFAQLKPHQLETKVTSYPSAVCLSISTPCVLMKNAEQRDFGRSLIKAGSDRFSINELMTLTWKALKLRT